MWNVAIGRVPKNPPKLGFSLYCTLDFLGDLIKMQVLIQEVAGRDEMPHSNKFPGDADAACPQV